MDVLRVREASNLVEAIDAAEALLVDAHAKLEEAAALIRESRKQFASEIVRFDVEVYGLSDFICDNLEKLAGGDPQGNLAGEIRELHDLRDLVVVAGRRGPRVDG
jgi:hypothetical protein